MSNTPREERRRPILLPLAGLMLGAALAVGSSASFTSSTLNPDNRYETGTLEQSNSRNDSWIFNASNLKPGDTVLGEVVISNTGTLDGVFSLSEIDAVNGFSDPDNLRLRVDDTTTGGVVFDGTLGTMGALPLGTFGAGEARTYRFTVQLLETAGNEEQGRAASATYRWDAVQTPPVTIDQTL